MWYPVIVQVISAQGIDSGWSPCAIAAEQPAALLEAYRLLSEWW